MYKMNAYLPNLYDDIVEMQSIMYSEQLLLGQGELATLAVLNNQFVMTSDEIGVAQYENQLGIIANPSIETLEFRKQRVINRLSTKPPFTFNYLKSRLDGLIGANKYNTYIDYNNYTLYIESSASNQQWAQEIIATINSIKPANIIFINKPLISNSIVISEEMSYNQIRYNYQLGTTWVLGAKSFASIENKGVIKLAEVSSIQDKLLNDLAAQTHSKIASIKINDTLSITNFTTKAVNNNLVTLEYLVEAGQGINEITNVKILDSQNNVLSNATVYVPLLEDVTMKHSIIIEEGVE